METNVDDALEMNLFEVYYLLSEFDLDCASRKAVHMHESTVGDDNFSSVNVANREYWYARVLVIDQVTVDKYGHRGWHP